MDALAEAITDLADGGVVIPFCAAVAAALLVRRRWRIAGIWAAVTLSVWAVMLALKLAGYAVATLVPGLAWLDLVTPSGHVAASACAYGGLAGLVARTKAGPLGTGLRLGIAVAGAVGLTVGVTRVMLGNHSPAEVAVGWLVGVAGAAAMLGWAQDGIAGRDRAVLLGAALAALVAFHGTHLTWEPAIRAASLQAVR